MRNRNEFESVVWNRSMPVKISVIIPTFNRADLLSKSIESVLSQTLPKEFYRVIVIDNASSDRTREICSGFSHLRRFSYFYEDREGLSAARIRGVHEADSPYVAFIDDDAVASSHWLEKLLCGFETATPKPGAVGGKILPVWESKIPEWLPVSKWVYLTVLDYGDTPGFIRYPQILYGANMAFDRKILLQHARFRLDLGRVGRKLIGGEDSWIFKQFSSKSIPVYYLPEASVSHYIPKGRATKRWLYRRHYWQGRTEILLLEGEVSNVEPKKLLSESVGQALRHLKSYCFAKTSGQRFFHSSEFMKQFGRCIQLRLMA